MANSKRLSKTWKTVISLVVLLGFVAIFYFGMSKTPKHAIKNIPISGVFLAKPEAIKDFKLLNQVEKPFTKENLKGQWTLMYFGFTNCGSVCPISMAALRDMYNILQNELPKQDMPQVVFVSLDPKRDNLQRIREFVRAFHPHFIGARAEPDETDALLKQFHIISEKIPARTADSHAYTLEHSADILIFNPQAELQAYLASPHQTNELVKDYKTILSTAENDPFFTDTEGRVVRLSHLKGRWVIINYWATWCRSCLTEIPELNKFHRRYPDVLLFGVNFDRMPSIELKKALRQMGIHFPVMIDDPKMAWRLGNVSVLPVTFIIDPKGRVVKTLLGPSTKKSLATTLTLLQHAQS